MRDAEEAVSHDRLALALERERSDRFDAGVALGQHRVASLTRIVPGSAACSSRAATLAVSPITV